MARYTPAIQTANGLPQQVNELPPVEPAGAAAPLAAGVALGQCVREEHGREGVRAYICALNPLLPRALVEQLAGKLGVEVPPPAPPCCNDAPPPPPPPKPPQKEAPAIPPELMLQLLQGFNGGGGLDPGMLLRMLQK